MKKISVVPEIMCSENISFFDENNIPVIICQKSNYKFNYNLFQPPSILIDNFEKLKYKDIEVRTIDLDYLKKFQYRLVSISLKGLSGCQKNYPSQKNCYMLESFTSPIPRSIILNKLPKEHLIEFDITNNRIRIKGRNVQPYNRAENASPWIQVVKK
jgi:hypothetical protein